MKNLTATELEKVMRIASENPRNHAMVLLAFKHGLRCSEVCNLTLSDIDLKNNEITIRRLKGSLKTTQPLEHHPNKPYLDERRVLRAWLKERHNATDYLFTSQKGGKLDRSAFFRVFSGICEQAGIDKDRRHPHVLKHSLGFLLAEGDVHISKIQQQLGHKSVASTGVYLNPTPQATAKAVHAAMLNAF
jgi:integrase